MTLYTIRSSFINTDLVGVEYMVQNYYFSKQYPVVKLVSSLARLIREVLPQITDHSSCILIYMIASTQILHFVQHAYNSGQISTKQSFIYYMI